MAGAPADSGGVPFAGRALPDPGFAGDDGAGDARLCGALEAFARDPAGEQEVLAALTAARVLVPVVAAAAEVDDTGPLRSEKSTDMAVATLVGTDGRRALPVFTSLSTQARWRADARPVPVEGRRAALAAAAEGADALVVDVAGPWSYVLDGRHALEALARGELAVPAYDDERLLAGVTTATAGVEGVAGATLVPAAGADARLLLDLLPDADVDAVVGTVARRLRAATARPLLRGIDIALLGPRA